VTAAAVRIPNRYVQALVRRGVACWLLARLMVIAIAALIAAMSGVEMIDMDDALTGTNIFIAIWTILMAVAITRLDLQRRHEVSLLNNLGVSAVNAIAIGVLPALAIESVLLLLT
jgi:hypothetical protein